MRLLFRLLYGLITFALILHFLWRPRKTLLTVKSKQFNPYSGVGLELKSSIFHERFERNDWIVPSSSDNKGAAKQSIYHESIGLIKDHRFIQVAGFQFCSILDGSSFDSLVPIRNFNGSLSQTNPDISEFVNLIDLKAYDIFQGLMRKFHLAHQKVLLVLIVIGG